MTTIYPAIEENDWWEIAGKRMLSDDLIAATYGVEHAVGGRGYLYIQITDGEHAGTEWEEEFKVIGQTFGQPKYELTSTVAARLFAQVRADGWEFHNEPDPGDVAYLIAPVAG